MIYELVNKGGSEVIDKINMFDVEIQVAKIYFMGRKQLPEDKFDKLFEVKESKYKTAHVGEYKWWKEERILPDSEKE